MSKYTHCGHNKDYNYHPNYSIGSSQTDDQDAEAEKFSMLVEEEKPTEPGNKLIQGQVSKVSK